MDGPTKTEQKFLAMAPKIPALISFAMSTSVILSFYRDARKRKRLYHRLAFVMSCYGVLFSFGLGMGTSLFPSDTSDAYGALGNKMTCTFQAIIAQLTLAVPLYYASLSVYSYVAINANFKQERIVWIEPWIHGLIHLYTVSSTIFMVASDNINPSGSVCWVATSPLICGPGTDVPCERGDARKVRLYIFVILFPIYAMIILASILMTKINIAQKNTDITKYKGKQEFLQKAKKRKTKIIALQSCLYFAAFVLSYSIAVISRSIIQFTRRTNYTLFIIGTTLAAFQNTFFTLVYLGLQIKPTPEEIVSAEKNYCATLRRRLSAPELSKRQSTNEHDDEAVEERPQQKRRSFSIFDGSSLSQSPWNQFLIDDFLEE